MFLFFVPLDAYTDSSVYMPSHKISSSMSFRYRSCLGAFGQLGASIVSPVECTREMYSHTLFFAITYIFVLASLENSSGIPWESRTERILVAAGRLIMSGFANMFVSHREVIFIMVKNSFSFLLELTIGRRLMNICDCPS